MRRKRNKVFSFYGNENKEKDNKKIKYLSLKHLFKIKTNTTTNYSTIDSNTFNTITNSYNTISNTFHTLSNERNSFKTEIHIPYQTKVQFTENSNLKTEESQLIKHRRIIKSPTQRKKQHSSTGIFTKKQLNMQKKVIESESKKPKRNRDYLRIKSKQEYLKEEENKKKINKKSNKNKFFQRIGI
jgi:hypothetical protein